MRSYFLPVFILSFLLTICSCKKTEKLDASETDELGKVHFPTTGSPEAQDHFKTGVLLLHSFEYEDARAAFKMAKEADPDHAMSYWGEAMTYNHTLWQRQQKDKALKVLEELGKTPEERLSKVKTELEQEIFKGIEILYGQGTKYERDVAYSDYMEELREKYPDNHEISAFYAVSLLGASRNGRDDKLYGNSARIAQSIIDENPNHPGALHYLIHSYDDPEHAHLAKDVADSYSKVAPDAAHALHMPSHIYVALGAWEDVVTSNIASWNASVRRMEKKNLDGDAKSYHAFRWLHYGLLQRGEIDAGQQLLDLMVKYVDEVSSKRARGANALQAGLIAFHEKDAESLETIIKELSKDRIKNAEKVGEKGFAMCNAAGYNSRLPSQLDVDMVYIMELELKALLADLNGESEAAKEFYENGIALDATLSYSYGPPTIVKPIQEAYGEWLLQNEDYNEAVRAFDLSLKRNPRRLRSLQGKMKAIEQLADDTVLAELQKELDKSLESKQWEAVL
jgi:tetratricopeptide (TPR) repeat protein